MTDGRNCGSCRYFRCDPDFIETAMPGLNAMGSAYAAVIADDGICLLHDRFAQARGGCAAFEMRV